MSVSIREISKADREITRDVVSRDVVSRDVVSREKYEKAKDAARSWYTKFITLKEENEKLRDNFNKLNEENEKVKDSFNKLSSENEKLNKQNLELSNSRENKAEVEELRKKHKESEERLKDKIANLEREKILAEGRVQHIDEARKDLYERYSELKSDYRELQKIVNKRD